MAPRAAVSIPISTRATADMPRLAEPLRRAKECNDAISKPDSQLANVELVCWLIALAVASLTADAAHLHAQVAAVESLRPWRAVLLVCTD